MFVMNADIDDVRFFLESLDIYPLASGRYSEYDGSMTYWFHRDSSYKDSFYLEIFDEDMDEWEIIAEGTALTEINLIDSFINQIKEKQENIEDSFLRTLLPNKIAILDKWLSNNADKLGSINNNEETDQFLNECLHHQRALEILNNPIIKSKSNFTNWADWELHNFQKIGNLEEELKQELLDLGMNPDLKFCEQLKELNERYNKKYNFDIYDNNELIAENQLKLSLCDALGLELKGIDKILQNLSINNENNNTKSTTRKMQ